MLKKLLSAVLVLPILLSSPAFTEDSKEWKTPPKAALEQKANDVLEVRWEGETDLEMLKQVRIDIQRALLDKKKVLSVAFLSPGGPVITSLEIARQVFLAREKGLVVEMHASGLVASGATLVLAAGWPGRRYISRWTVFIVHGLQGGMGFGPPSCMSIPTDPKDEQDRAIVTIYKLFRDFYILTTGKSQEEVESWLTCGQERVGSGALAVTMGIADEVRE